MGAAGRRCRVRGDRLRRAVVAAPLAALDLPLKVVVWDDDGQTKVSYYSPDALAARHHLGAGLSGNLAAVNALTDALIAS